MAATQTSKRKVRSAKRDAPDTQGEGDAPQVTGMEEQAAAAWEAYAHEAKANGFLQFIEGGGLRETFDPLAAETLQLQAKYIAEVGAHPFDCLKSIVKNPFCKAGDRINASKILLEYSHRKIPAQLEVTGRDGTEFIKVSAMQLVGKLSDKELSTLQQLLEKAQKA